MGWPESVIARTSISGEDDGQDMMEMDRRTGMADADTPRKAGE